MLGYSDREVTSIVKSPFGILGDFKWNLSNYKN